MKTCSKCHELKELTDFPLSCWIYTSTIAQANMTFRTLDRLPTNQGMNDEHSRPRCK